jgi:hypothetical protein
MPRDGSDPDHPPTRGERRAARQLAARERMAKHGKGLGEVYRNAVLKRLARQKSSKSGAKD